MAWETTLDIAGVTSSNLVAGAEAAGVDAGTINVYSAGGEPGVLNNASAIADGIIIVSGGGVANYTVTSNGGILKVSSGGRANSTTVGSGPTASWGMVVSKNGVAYDTRVYSGGSMYVSANATVNDVIVNGYLLNYGMVDGLTVFGTIAAKAGVISDAIISGGNFRVSQTAQVTNATIFGGTLQLNNGALADNVTVNGGTLQVLSNTTASSVILNPNGTLEVRSAGSADLAYNPWQGAATVKSSAGAIITSQTLPNAGVYYGGTVSGLIAKGDSLTDLTVEAGNSAIVYNDGEMTSTTIAGGNVIVSGGELTSTTVTAGNIHISAGVATLTTVAGGNMYVSEGGTASATVLSGGKLTVQSGGIVSGATIFAGGSMELTSGAVIKDLMTIDFTGISSHTVYLINDMNYVADDTPVLVKISEWNSGALLYVCKTGNPRNRSTGVTVTDGAATATLTSGGYITNPFAGIRYLWNGGRLQGSVYSFTATAGTAGALSTDTAASINGGDLAVKWTSATAFTSGNVYLAGETTNGKAAWLEIDGYEGGTGTTLYGAQGDAFASGTVNINAKSGSLRNLAAGANAGGTVKAVNLTFAGAELDGTGYAGGFGNVTNEVNTTVTTGTFTKDFYAGALANKLTTTTSVGDVSMTIDGGTFDGNIYGASAVKTDSTKGTGTRHTAGDVTLTVTGGTTTKGAQACIFAGGYATGDATGTVYTVASVTAKISGGSWGEAAGGRGVFGGIFASGVEAQVLGNVNITISGDATMGNVYGGGWAQKTGAKSIVGDVNINIEGGTITNVFGGGSHSTSGGTTETGDVTITVSGGNITGDIYARGQLDGDITGAASVIFTGANDFDCGVFGYSYVGGAASDAALSFSTYTGEFSGNIGGFNGITLDGATAMTLTAIADDVSNGAWEFDLTDRADTLAGTSLLTWSGASFENDTIKVTFADDTQAQGGWNIATVAEAFSGTTFDVKVGDSEIATGLAYNQQIASGDYAGWGFELESGVLKFKQLA